MMIKCKKAGRPERMRKRKRAEQTEMVMKHKKVELSDRDLRKLQLNLLEMLIEIDRICRKYGIEYSLDGGTLLGAVRHKGFIPWDDDIDVIMRRDEYVKFYRACKREMDKKRFFLQEYRTDSNYRWGYAKLRRKGTEYIRLGQEHLKNRTGVFVDIFVADNVPDDYLLRRMHYAACFVIRKLLYSELGMKSADSLAGRIWYGVCYKLVPRNRIFRLRNRIAKKCSRKKTQLVAHMTYPYPKQARFGMPAACFDEMMDIEFEGHTFRCFKKYDLYLSLLFGDYMKLPPKEKQVMHLDASRIELLEPEAIFEKSELDRLEWV